MKKPTTLQKLWIGIALLALLSPLGIIIPRMLGAGGAWGEWGIRELERLTGFLPQGMKRDAGAWKAPLPDYAVPGQSDGIAGAGAGYLVAGIAGLLVTAAAAWCIAKALGKKHGKGEGTGHGQG